MLVENSYGLFTSSVSALSLLLGAVMLFHMKIGEWN